ncbi:VCBS domain-containing protein [Vibrio lentus]|nr:VCBS domain-containing protein [Vibrio lentus]
MLTIDPDGAWTYVVNNDDVQYLDDDGCSLKLPP